MSKKRIGIFGGTFNPPHIGHVISAEYFCREMNLDKLLIIPTFLPPHKVYDSSVTCEDRLEMCRLAFSQLEIAEISDVEIKRGGTSYTYITLQELSSDDIELFMLCGTDMLLSLDRWKNPDIIFDLAAICYVRRENQDYNTEQIENKCQEYTSRYNARIYPISNAVVEISSTEIRNSDNAKSAMLPDAVHNYIIEKGLYK